MLIVCQGKGVGFGFHCLKLGDGLFRNEYRMIRQREVALFFVICIVFLAACQPPPSPSPVASPTCQILLNPTTERFIELDFLTRLPSAAAPGDTLQLSFEGGYVLFLEAEVCGGEIAEATYAYPQYSDRSREVEILLDEVVIHTAQCTNHCEVEFSIPQDISLGRHEISLDVSSYLFTDNNTFLLDIIPSP